MLFTKKKATDDFSHPAVVVIVCGHIIRKRQGMGFSVFAISAGILEMIGRAFAAIILIPNIGFMGACLASPIAWIAADAFLFPAFIHCAKKLNARHNIKSN